MTKQLEWWEYTCHIRLPAGKIMEVQGAHYGTSDQVEAQLDVLAEKESGSIIAIMLKCSDTGRPEMVKPRVKTTQEKQAVLSLPAPPPPPPPKETPKYMLRLNIPGYPTPSTFVHTRSNDNANG